MQDYEFHEKIDHLLHYIEDKLDHYEGDTDIDYEIQAGILTISFEDGSKIIINRQEPLHQLWMATKFNGHHFSFDEKRDTWICVRSQDTFFEVLSDAITRQSGITFNVR